MMFSNTHRSFVALLTVVILTSSAVGPVTAQVPGPGYEVRPGDTLYSIALAFGTSVEALQVANNLADADALAVGQRLVIPGLDGVEGELDFHVVGAGETLTSVSKRLGQPLEVLTRMNRVVNPSQVYLGQPLIVRRASEENFRGRSIPTWPGEALLGVAARTGLSPWSLVAHNPYLFETAGLTLPGHQLAVPTGEAEFSALPWPLETLVVHPLPPEQGRTLSVALTAVRPVNVEGQFGDWTLTFVEQGGGHFALQGLHALAEPDLYSLTIRASDESGRVVEFSQSVNLRDGGYGQDPPLRVDPDLIDPSVVDPEFQQLLELVTPVTAPDRYWDGLFQWPSNGPITSYFGTRRSYNGSAYEYFHSGTDFRGGTGTPILAPAPGVVVFAGELKVRGLATVIDHGWGIYTGYWHQSELSVAVGQRVEAGQEIGKVGDTGRVTGPHLHWELWVGGVQVDPAQWTEEVFP